MLPSQRAAYQRTLSLDAKPMGGEGGVNISSLATRRNIPCPTLVKQENMDTPIRGTVPNGYPAGMAVCPPRGNPTSNISTYYFHFFFLKYFKITWLFLNT